MKVVSQLALAILFLVGCSRPAEPDGLVLSTLNDDIRAEKTISLQAYTTFNWDRVYIFQPYIPESVIREDTGTDIKFPHSDSEGHCLLLFTRQGQAPKAIEVQRIRADFSRLYRKEGYSRDEAIFNVIVDKSPIQNWWHLERKQ
ncbi:MAG: hypothetical protein ORN23_08745 [Chthoniobacterales bacterium]|jgi:hypothetical protein|nr:hypothetical protein [Chthoniobacterales bacterium]